MIILVLLIFISLFIAIVFLFVFLWNVRSGQYDDMYTPSIRMLFEDKKSDATKEAGPREEQAG